MRRRSARPRRAEATGAFAESAGGPERRRTAPGNWARPATSFFGREAELEAIARALESGVRLVTLLGPAGIGKTRLAIEVAERSGCVWFCDLGEARTLDAAVAAVAAALDIPLVRPSSLEAAIELGNALAERGDLLLVLDGLELVAGEAARAIEHWLSLAPEARFVVTSRVALALQAETRIDLGGLPLAAGLELLRARALAKGGTLDSCDQESETLRRVVELLEGIPLAIELAAPRLRVMSSRALLDRLSRSFGDLINAPREAPARQASLRAAIEESFDLLTPQEGAALMRCAVFRSGFDLHAVEAVVGRELDAERIVDVLAALRDKSMLHALETRAGERRLALYEAVRELAEEKLSASGQRAEVEAAHSAHYLSQAERHAGHVLGPDAAQSLAWLGAEIENLRAVAERDALGAPEIAVRITLALVPLLRAKGPVSTLIGLLQAAESVAEPDADPELAARVAAALGDAWTLCGDMEAAERAISRALACAGDHAAPRAEARRVAGNLRIAQARYSEATRELEDALSLFRALGDRAGQAMTLAHLGTAEGCAGLTQQAREHLEEAANISRAIGYRYALPTILSNLGMVELEAAALDRAEQLFQEAIATERALGTRRYEASALANLGGVYTEQGQLAEARACFERAIEASRQIGHRRAEALALLNLGILAHQEGRLDEAEQNLRKAGELYASYANRELEAAARCHLAAVRARRGALEEAERLFGKQSEIPRARADAASRTLRDLLEGFLDLAKADLASERGEEAAARNHVARAEGRLAQALAPTGAPRASGVRDAVRLLSAVLGPSRSARMLVVWPEARWVRGPGGEKVDLRKRVSHRRILLRLIQSRADSPGRGISTEALFEAGWPEDRASAESAANRVWVALAALRRSGLRDVLHRDADGYFLDPNVILAFEREP